MIAALCGSLLLTFQLRYIQLNFKTNFPPLLLINPEMKTITLYCMLHEKAQLLLTDEVGHSESENWSFGREFIVISSGARE